MHSNTKGTDNLEYDVSSGIIWDNSVYMNQPRQEK